MVSTTPPTPQTDVRRVIATPTFTGGAAALLTCADTEVCLDGPAGTGKSYAALWKMHLRRILFPGSRGLLARKSLIALKSSTLVTFREQVLGPLLTSGAVRFWGSRGDEPAHYAYWNGSKVVIVGLDKPGKAMSTEYDDILVDEALDTDERDIEALLTRIQRPGHLYGVEGRPPYAQLVLVTNPGAPTHWLNQRMLTGRTTRIPSRHSDNPAMTPAYLALLNHNLTGVRRKRLFLGIWAAAEGAVYEDTWNPDIHVVKRATYTQRGGGDLWGNCGLPDEWPRYLGIDWGYRNPAVVKWYARLPDGELLVYREIYVTMTLVEDLAREALSLMGWRLSPETGALTPTRRDPDPLPREIIADHDAEDRATFERHFGLGVFPADKGAKSISDGIQAVTKRLQDRRLLYLEGSLVRRDPLLDQAKKPASSLDEFESYVWDTRAGRAPRETPMDENNHGMDVDRYVVRYFDRDDPSGGSRIAFEAIGF